MMKELETKPQDKIEAIAEIPVKKELKLLGSLRPHNGHKCFELDMNTRKITEAKFEKVVADYTKAGDGIRKKLIVREGCLYCTALNKENAKKKFAKQLHTILTTSPNP